MAEVFVLVGGLMLVLEFVKWRRCRIFRDTPRSKIRSLAMGLVEIHGSVLHDRIRIERGDNGLDAPLAVVEVCQRRLRPILLTVATTIGGLIPLAYGDEIMLHPQAISIIFGLMFATVLTLGFVPILYSLFFRVSFKSFDYGQAGK
ncbi:MAG: efflux RND transporter permease subunit [candidate division Zixibacteria bacterium]|nr:efflux RND transporter permease subunit [candidate division Zixibacteria bacterium]